MWIERVYPYALASMAMTSMFFFFFCSVLLFFSCFLCAPLQQLACYRLFYSATTPLSSSSPHPPRPSIFLSWITHFIPTQLSITWHQLSLQQENNHSNITRILFCFLILATKMTFLDGSPPPSLGCHTKASSRMTVLLLHNMNVLTEIRGEHIWFFILGGLSFFVLLGVPKANKIKSENERTNIFCVQQKTNKRRHKQTTHKNQQRATGSKQKEETIHVFGHWRWHFWDFSPPSSCVSDALSNRCLPRIHTSKHEMHTFEGVFIVHGMGGEEEDDVPNKISTTITTQTTTTWSPLSLFLQYPPFKTRHAIHQSTSRLSHQC